MGKSNQNQAALTLQERIASCEAGLALRTKQLRSFTSDYLSTLIVSLKDHWNDFSFEIKAKICDAKSDVIQRELAECFIDAGENLAEKFDKTDKAISEGMPQRKQIMQGR